MKLQVQLNSVMNYIKLYLVSYIPDYLKIKGTNTSVGTLKAKQHLVFWLSSHNILHDIWPLHKHAHEI